MDKVAKKILKYKIKILAFEEIILNGRGKIVAYLKQYKEKTKQRRNGTEFIISKKLENQQKNIFISSYNNKVVYKQVKKKGFDIVG